MEKTMELTSVTKSYEKELHSDEPFIRSMYEDLERRIEDFENDALNEKQKVNMRDFVVVTVVISVITLAVFIF